MVKREFFIWAARLREKLIRSAPVRNNVSSRDIEAPPHQPLKVDLDREATEWVRSRDLTPPE
jgi:hypothetical protein